MSKWELDDVSLEWNHGDDDSGKLSVRNSSHAWARIDISTDQLRELASMIAKALDEMAC